MYGAETIRTKIGEDLAGITVANGYSFTAENVDVSGEDDPEIMGTPALQLIAVEGAAEPLGTRTGGASMGISTETTVYALDLFLRDGEYVSLERAAADVRNRLERVASAVRAAGVGGFKDIRVLGWEFLEGPDVRRTLEHRVRLRLEVERIFNLGDA